MHHYLCQNYDRKIYKGNSYQPFFAFVYEENWCREIIFKFPLVEERFCKAPFSLRISVDDKAYRGKQRFSICPAGLTEYGALRADLHGTTL